MQNGDQVIVAGAVDVYAKTGSYQLYANQIIKDGVGALAERFEQLKKKLLEQGMFDQSYKQPIPSYVRRLGVVTAATGAAVRDIIQISKRRNPFIEIILYPAIVQGEAAPDSIIRGIRTLDELGVDVIIIGRGGGSLEDLWAFNEERVAEAVFDCSTPIISAVGHETDTVITDFVADLRAPTPSAAAELAVFDLRRYDADIDRFRHRLDDAMYKKIQSRRTDLLRLQRELHHLSPDARIRDQRQTVDRFWDRLDQLMTRRIENARMNADRRDRLDTLMNRRITASRHRMELLAGSLAHLSPLARLSGGYGFVSTPDGHPIRYAHDIRPADHFRLHLRDGLIEATADKVTELSPGS